MSDLVLDLSAKSTSDGALTARSLSRETPPSPVTPVSRSRRHPSSDDDHDSETSAFHPGTSARTGHSSIPVFPRENGSPSSTIDHNDKRSPASSPLTSSSLPLSPRPFKSFPADSVASSVFSPPSPGIFSGSNGMPTLPMGFGLTSLFENSASFPTFPVTPLTSHLLQRKRRAESRVSVSHDSNSDSDSKCIQHVPEEKKDGSYWERRRKNNEAAKRSRDNRRQKEEEIAMRAAFLEQENLKLRAQVAILKNETAKLHYMLYNRI